ncbi:hypothetical protein [Desulfonatronum parangueonense]
MENNFKITDDFHEPVAMFYDGVSKIQTAIFLIKMQLKNMPVNVQNELSKMEYLSNEVKNGILQISVKEKNDLLCFLEEFNQHIEEFCSIPHDNITKVARIFSTLETLHNGSTWKGTPF